MSSFFNRKELIYTIYNERSFSKAAQKLYISQPSLSTMVHKIEEELGFPLFDRTCKPIRMTEPGMEYIKATEEIMHIEKAFENYADAYKNLQTGSLTLGSNQLLSSLVLPKYISAFVRSHPQISLHLVDDNSVVLENQIISGKLDLIIDNQVLDPEIFEQKVLITEYLLLAVPASFTCNHGLEAYGLTYKDILTGRHLSSDVPAAPLEAFTQIPYISMTKNNDTRIRCDKILRQAGVKLTPILEIDRLMTLYYFVEMGTAASIISDTLVQHIQHHSDNVLFYRIDSPLVSRDIYVSYKRSKYYSKAMASFIELLFQMMKNEVTF